MNLQKMMQQAQVMQQKMQETQLKLEAAEFEGSAGGGAVTVRLNGKNQMLKVAVNAALLKPEEKEMLEDLVVAAHRDARKKIDDNFNEQMKNVTGGLNLPPGFKLPF